VSAVLPPGTALGSCTLGEAVRKEAFTVTYEAEQRLAGRKVWVRTLKSTVSAKSPHAEGLEREARALSKLEHENVIRLYAVERSETTLALVLERVPGPTLEELAAKGRAQPECATAIALAIARGLAQAHARSIVHGGLRPDRVIAGGEGDVKIVDWSNAIEVGAPLPSVEPEGTLVAPDWLAPEQLAGEAPDARSDVFSTGAIAYELIAGARPFEAPEPRSVARRIRAGDAPPLATIVEGIPRPIERIVARSLALDPRDRFDDGAALATALADALAELTPLSPRALVARALAAAGFGTATLAPIPRRTQGELGPSVVDALRPLLVVLAFIVGGAIAIESLRDDDDRRPFAADARTLAHGRDRALLRVVAHPWAEIYVDGEHVETTPLARAIPLAPGRHFVTFRHPNAPDEQRSIKIAAGQSVFLDVTMRVDRGDAGLRVDAGAAASP